MEIGSLQFWDSKPFLQAADILVAADEPLKAVELLKNLPAFYRDHIPVEIAQTIKDIYAQLATPHFYMSNKWDVLPRSEAEHRAIVDNTLRGRIIQTDIKLLNDKGLEPYIIDLGPGEYWLPMGLRFKGLKFKYYDIGLCPEAKKIAMLQLGNHYLDPKDFKHDQPVVYVACEIIEHMHYEKDLHVELARTGCSADIIHVSTPKYTYDGSAQRLDWRKYGDLGHLRTYTPKDFQDTVCGMFYGYSWQFAVDIIMHLRGVKDGNKFL